MVVAAMGRAADWPHWRGPTGDGLSVETGWTAETVAKKKVLWTAQLGKGYSSFAVVGDKVFTMGHFEGKDIVYCLDAATGKAVWTYRYACEEGRYAGPRATPCVDGDAVYTVSRQGLVLCLNRATGEVKWDNNISDGTGAEVLRWGHAGSVRVVGDLAVVAIGKTGIALNKKTGKKVWAGGPGKYAYASPVPFKVGAKPAIAFFGANAVTAVDAKTGKDLWSHPWLTKYDVNAADPLFTDAGMFISSGYGTGCAMIDISKAKPKLLWQNKLVRAHFSSPVIINGHIYAADGNAGRGHLVCIDAKTGEEKWREDKGFGSLMAADGKLIFLNGSISVLFGRFDVQLIHFIFEDAACRA